MNKLLKKARSSDKVAQTMSSQANLYSRSDSMAISTKVVSSYGPQCNPVAHAVGEQYWATRTLVAETLLSAEVEHRKEMRAAAYREKLERSVRYIFHCFPSRCDIK